MATRLYYRHDRFYFNKSQHKWDAESSSRLAFAGGLDTSKTSEGSDVNVTQTLNGVSGQSLLWHSFVSKPLTAQSISGTVKGQMRCYEGGTGMNLSSQMRIYLIDGVTGAIKSTLYGGAGAWASGAEWSTTTTNRQMPQGGSVALTSQTAVAGDRLLAMVGAICGANFTGMPFFLDTKAFTGADLPEDTTTTDATRTPWLEFSADLVFDTDVEMVVFLADEAATFDGLAQRDADARYLYGEQDAAEGVVIVPTTLQLWPRGNRG